MKASQFQSEAVFGRLKVEVNTMKKIKMFMFDECPHCQKALRILDDLMSNNEKYREVEIEKINEKKHPEIADQYDYYYVPTFYIDEVKVHEGTVTEEDVLEVLEKAIA